MATFDPSNMRDETPLGTLRVEKEETPEFTRFMVRLYTEGKPPEELQCGGDPTWSYNYFCGFVTALHMMGKAGDVPVDREP